MITRLEATRYRCFERLGVDVGDFRVLDGANGSGKTTLLDLPELLGDLLGTTSVGSVFLERRNGLPARAGTFRSYFKRDGGHLSLGCAPFEVNTDVGADLLVGAAFAEMPAAFLAWFPLEFVA